MNPLAPPWILFSDNDKPIAILPAGRSGEIANVEGMSLKTVQAIINAANSGVPDPLEALEKIREELEKALKVAQRKT